MYNPMNLSINSFEQWLDVTDSTITALGRVLENKGWPHGFMKAQCPVCKGAGYTTSICSCCGNDKEDDCHYCDAHGYFDLEQPIDIEALKEAMTANSSNEETYQQYFSEVVNDIRLCCLAANWDFFEKVGPFVRDFRQQYPNIKV